MPDSERPSESVAKTFSQRQGLKPLPKLQFKAMSPELRASLWNVMHAMIWGKDGFLHRYDYEQPGIVGFANLLWFSFFKKPISNLSDQHGNAILEQIKGVKFSF